MSKTTHFGFLENAQVRSFHNNSPRCVKSSRQEGSQQDSSSSSGEEDGDSSTVAAPCFLIFGTSCLEVEVDVLLSLDAAGFILFPSSFKMRPAVVISGAFVAVILDFVDPFHNTVLVPVDAGIFYEA